MKRLVRVVLAVAGGATPLARLWLIAPLVLAVLLRPGAAKIVEAADPMFGNGSDGAITFSSNTQFNPPVDAVVVSGFMGGSTLTVSSPSGAFLAGQRIMIHQTRGSGAGMWELHTVQSYALGNIITSAALAHTYASSGADRAQILVLPQYTNVTVNAGVTVTAKPWNESTGGILAWYVNDTLTVNGAIAADGVGFRGSLQPPGDNQAGRAGEGTGGAAVAQTSPNGNGGGGSACCANAEAGGAGGGNGGPGADGQFGFFGQGTPGSGGAVAGSADLSSIVFGGAGGNGGGGQGQDQKKGGNGGGIVAVLAASVSFGASGQDLSRGSNGDGANTSNLGGNGGGAGGSVLIRASSAAFGSGQLVATGGAGGPKQDFAGPGGSGGVGRIRAEYCISISGGTANPPASVAQISCDLGPPDTDNDGEPDSTDNCATVPNGPAQAGIPGVGNQTNTDGGNAAQNRGGQDTLGDACDPDKDGDGYSDVQEATVVPAKSDLSYCTIMRADVNGDGTVALADLIILAGLYNKNVPPAPERLDQNGDLKIALADLIIAAGIYNKPVTLCP